MSGQQALDAAAALLARLAAGVSPREAALAAGVVCAAILILAGGFVARRRLARRARGGGRRAGAARALARKGLGAPEIARRTGLSRDAVEMLLAARPDARGRRNLPGSARIAAPAGGPSRPPRRGFKPHLLAAK